MPLVGRISKTDKSHVGLTTDSTPQAVDKAVEVDSEGMLSARADGRCWRNSCMFTEMSLEAWEQTLHRRSLSVIRYDQKRREVRSLGSPIQRRQLRQPRDRCAYKRGFATPVQDDIRMFHEFGTRACFDSASFLENNNPMDRSDLSSTRSIIGPGSDTESTASGSSRDSLSAESGTEDEQNSIFKPRLHVHWGDVEVLMIQPSTPVDGITWQGSCKLIECDICGAMLPRRKHSAGKGHFVRLMCKEQEDFCGYSCKVPRFMCDTCIDWAGPGESSPRLLDDSIQAIEDSCPSYISDARGKAARSDTVARHELLLNWALACPSAKQLGRLSATGVLSERLRDLDVEIDAVRFCLKVTQDVRRVALTRDAKLHIVKVQAVMSAGLRRHCEAFVCAVAAEYGQEFDNIHPKRVEQACTLPAEASANSASVNSEEPTTPAYAQGTRVTVPDSWEDCVPDSWEDSFAERTEM